MQHVALNTLSDQEVEFVVVCLGQKLHQEVVGGGDRSQLVESGPPNYGSVSRRLVHYQEIDHGYLGSYRGPKGQRQTDHSFSIDSFSSEPVQWGAYFEVHLSSAALYNISAELPLST